MIFLQFLVKGTWVSFVVVVAILEKPTYHKGSDLDGQYSEFMFSNVMVPHSQNK